MRASFTQTKPSRFAGVTIAILTLIGSAATTATSDDEVNGNGMPVITDFFIMSNPGNLWTFEGTVTDENPGTVVIVFGGMIEGTVTPVTEEGTFSITILLPAGTSGVVSAQAWDEWDVASDIVEDLIE
jgi:hypothetical protein